MDPVLVKWIGRAALAAVLLSGIWQGVLPTLDARSRTRFARELAAARGEERRVVALGWAFRRWVSLAAAPLAMMVAAAEGLGELDDRMAAGVGLPVAVAVLGAFWQLATTLAAVRRLERPKEGRA